MFPLPSALIKLSVLCSSRNALHLPWFSAPFTTFVVQRPFVNFHVGETGRPLEERKKEHLRAVRELDVDRSELAKHVHETNHKIPFDDKRCLEREDSWKRRITKVALWARKVKSANRTKTDTGRFYDCIL